MGTKNGKGEKFFGCLVERAYLGFSSLVVCTVPQVNLHQHPAQCLANGKFLHKYLPGEWVKILISLVWISEVEETFERLDSNISISFYSWGNMITGQNSTPFPKRMRSLPFLSPHFRAHSWGCFPIRVKVSMSLWPFIDFSVVILFPHITGFR